MRNSWGVDLEDVVYLRLGQEKVDQKVT